MLNCGVGLFVVCVFITSASWLLLTSHESTRVIKQAHFGRPYLGHLQLGETMAREEVAAARLVVAVTLLLARCSHPSSAVPRCKAFWSACRKVVASVTRLEASSVSRRRNIPSSMLSWRTGMTWRRSGTTHSTTSAGLHRRALCVRKRLGILRPTENAGRRSCSRRSTCPPFSWRSRLCCSCSVQHAPREPWWIYVTLCLTQFPSTKVTFCRTPIFRLYLAGRHRVLGEDLHGARVLLRHHSRTWECTRCEGTVVLHGSGMTRKWRAPLKVQTPRRAMSFQMETSSRAPECFRRPDALFHILKKILGLFFLWCGFLCSSVVGRTCTRTSCCWSAPPCSKWLVSAWRRFWARWHHPLWRSRLSLHFCESIQCGLVHLVSVRRVFERVQVVFHRHNVCGSIWLRNLLCVLLAYGHAPWWRWLPRQGRRHGWLCTRSHRNSATFTLDLVILKAGSGVGRPSGYACSALGTRESMQYWLLSLPSSWVFAESDVSTFRRTLRSPSPEAGEAVRVLLSRVRALAEILAIAESLFRNSLEGDLKIIEYPVKLVLEIVEPVLNRTCRYGVAVIEVIDVFPSIGRGTIATQGVTCSVTKSRSEPCGESVVEPGVRVETLMHGASERRLVDVSCPLSVPFSRCGSRRASTTDSGPTIIQRKNSWIGSSSSPFLLLSPQCWMETVSSLWGPQGSGKESFFSNEFFRAHLSISRLSHLVIVSIMGCKLRVRLLVDFLHCHGWSMTPGHDKILRRWSCRKKTQTKEGDALDEGPHMSARKAALATVRGTGDRSTEEEQYLKKKHQHITSVDGDWQRARSEDHEVNGSEFEEVALAEVENRWGLPTV